MPQPKPEVKSNRSLVTKYLVIVIIYTIIIAVFSIIMAGISSIRSQISQTNFTNTENIYNGALQQSAPYVRTLDDKLLVTPDYNFTKEQAQYFADNTLLTSTDSKVVINADFVKKGLVYQPTYQTKFQGEFTLSNKLNEVSAITFDFPFPVNGDTNEISNAVLTVDGKVIDNAKVRTATFTGLRWVGKIAANKIAKVTVSYDTVGLSYFSYNGIENSKGSQDFKFALTINGTRSYDVTSGLSVDKRDFAENSVTLQWDKKALYSRPTINVSVGEKLNPSEQVARIYLTMSPIYIIFISILVYLSYRFGKQLGLFDLSLITVLFTVFFPFVHYLSSFTIDPTVEVFSGIANVASYSMPLYTAFAAAWVVIGGYLYNTLVLFIYLSKQLNPDLLLLVTASAEEIMKRRKSDTTRFRGDDADIDAIKQSLELTYAYASSYSVMTGSPLYVLHNKEGRIEAAINESIDLLKQFLD